MRCALVPEIRQLEEVELFHKILQSVKTAASPEALRQLWYQA